MLLTLGLLCALYPSPGPGASPPPTLAKPRSVWKRPWARDSHRRSPKTEAVIEAGDAPSGGESGLCGPAEEEMVVEYKNMN